MNDHAWRASLRGAEYRGDGAAVGRAFRRFKDVLARWPDELERWYAFSEERQRGRARAWLADAGYDAKPPKVPLPEL